MKDDENLYDMQSACFELTVGSIVTCPACGISCPRNPGVRQRRLCPYCGALYEPATSSSYNYRHEESVPMARHSAAFLPDIQSDQRPGPLRAFGHFLAGRIGFPPGVVTGVVVRPTADIYLPPIGKESSSTLEGARYSSPRRSSRRSGRDTADHSSDESWSADLESPSPIDYPVRDKTKEEFLADVTEAKANNDFSTIREFYMQAFGSFQEINASFKNDPHEDGADSADPGIKTSYLQVVYDKLREMPSVIQKYMLKAMVNALLQRDKRLYLKDDVRAAFILLQNPLFSWQASFPVLAHLLRFICALPKADHLLLMGWLKKIKTKTMKTSVKNLLQFLTVSQFTAPNDTRTMSHPPRKWWVPSVAKVLALFNAVNNSCKPMKIPYTDLYNSALDHLDLMTEYYEWQNPDRPDRFSYCQYPFVLSIVAKRLILRKDSEHQMIMNARRSLVATIIQNEAPNLDIFFLNLNVRRSHLVSDSLNEITRKQRDLKKKLRVTFVGEPGLDMGGLTKEWFLLLIRQIFHPDYGMFVYHPESHCYWFSLTRGGNLREYNLIGVLMGLAVYNSIILDVRFPFICYRKLLTPPVVPPLSSSPIGLCPLCTPDDLGEVMPDVARSLNQLLSYEGDVENDLGLTFQVSVEEYGRIKTHNLKTKGHSINVTKENREEFVKLYLNWIINKAIYEQFKAFYLGFHSVCASNALIMLRPEEVEVLVCGTLTLDLEELKKVTIYEGCTAKDKIIKDFWEVLCGFNTDDQRKFLLFTTGTDRIPVGGIGEMTFKISLATDRTDMLPISHTCFNQLILPKYENQEIMKEKLIIAINNAEGFGLE